jgi:DNA repair ATPase RecN
MAAETALQAAERRIAEINRLLEKLHAKVEDLRVYAEKTGRWTDDLAHIQYRLAELVGEEG